MDSAKFQRMLGVTVDGVAGPVTWTAFFRKCGASKEMAPEFGRCAADHFTGFGITSNTLRLAHYTGELLHESGTFRYMEEIASGAAYEGRADLGNTRPGDGKRYKGRGPIQITGRANYRDFGTIVGVDLENHPERAAEPYIGLHVSLAFWRSRNLNAFADRDDIVSITRRINGGTNGIADRRVQVAKVKGWLA